MTLLTEFKQRRIWRVLIAYPSIVFVLLQAVEFFINNYGLDHRILTACIIAAVVLLPAAFVWNWRHGEEGHQSFSRNEIVSYTVFGLSAILAAGWYWRAAPIQESSESHGVAAARSIAVMPFENAGNDIDVQYLCDGIAESLINWLATVPGVRVVSKSAAFRLRDHADNTGHLVDELAVDNVIRGRLDRRGDAIVISASLIDTRDDSQLWGDRMVEPVAKVLNLERTIVAAIKDGLRLEMADTAPAKTASGGTDDPEAYQRYLRGHFLIQASDEASIDLGLEDLRHAISIDPQFALPYADIAAAMLQKVLFGMQSGESLKGEARTAAYTAVALAPDLPEAHIALASMHQSITFDWAAAEDAYEAAIALSPISPSPYVYYSDFLWGTLRHDRALEMAQRALEIDPKNNGAMHALGITLFYSGDFPAAANAFKQWNQFYPGSRWSYVKMALALALSGQCDQSAAPAETAERLAQGNVPPLYDAWLAWGHQVCGRNEAYQVSKNRLEAIRLENPDGIDLGILIYRILEGDHAGAISMIEKLVDSRSPQTLFLQNFTLDYLQWPISDRLAKDPRLLDLIKDLNFPPL